MQHGFGDSSDTFIVNTINHNAPAFIAADAGYDVWIGNTRGNKYSQEHVKYNSKVDAEYWDHSFTDLYNYDIKAFFEYIKRIAKPTQKITYVGHS